MLFSKSLSGVPTNTMLLLLECLAFVEIASGNVGTVLKNVLSATHHVLGAVNATRSAAIFPT